MKSKDKTAGRPARYTIEFGEERIEKMERFRARKRDKGQVISTITKLNNILVDIALEKEGIKL